MMLFFIGIIEMMVITSWTKLVSETKVLASGAVTLINIIIWYYVLRTIVDDIYNWNLAFIYACGCALGTIISTYFFQLLERGSLKKYDKRRAVSLCQGNNIKTA